jgi:hypothetical protein
MTIRQMLGQAGRIAIVGRDNQFADYFIAMHRQPPF